MHDFRWRIHIRKASVKVIIQSQGTIVFHLQHGSKGSTSQIFLGSGKVTDCCSVRVFVGLYIYTYIIIYIYYIYKIWCDEWVTLWCPIFMSKLEVIFAPAKGFRPVEIVSWLFVDDSRVVLPAFFSFLPVIKHGVLHNSPLTNDFPRYKPPCSIYVLSFSCGFPRFFPFKKPPLRSGISQPTNITDYCAAMRNIENIMESCGILESNINEYRLLFMDINGNRSWESMVSGTSYYIQMSFLSIHIPIYGQYPCQPSITDFRNLILLTKRAENECTLGKSNVGMGHPSCWRILYTGIWSGNFPLRP